MGFVTGFFQDELLSGEVLPPWLSGIRCAGPEPEVGACRRSIFGDTSFCGPTQRLFCFSSRVVLRHEAALPLPVLTVCASSSPVPRTHRLPGVGGIAHCVGADVSGRCC